MTYHIYNIRGKMKRRGVILKIIAIAILLFLVIAAAGQTDITIFLEDKEIFDFGKGGPLGLWEDNFNDASKIDPNPPGSGMSDNYIVSGGKVKMIDTYDAWTDSSWTKLRVIDVTNNAGQTLDNYALKMTINYDSDMQSDYADLRFKHESDYNTWLSYWIESYDSTQADVWVNIPTLQMGTTELYMFYGNSDASSESDIGGVFIEWDEQWSDDELITYKMDKEGCWDPDVSYGNGEFLVCWEEGQPYWALHGLLGFKQEIRASIYEPDNQDPVVFDKEVFTDTGWTYYRNEDPSIAFGGGKWFVAWEHYQPKMLPPHNPDASTMDIKARTVTRSGSSLSLGSVIDVCSVSECQADANVEFDSVNNRFMVVWEDARDGTDDYDIRASTYSTSGGVIVSNKLICNDANSQCEPWAAFDPINEQYFIVWEDGVTADVGPFRIKGGIFDDDLNPIWTGTIAEPSGYPNDDVDYNFPCVFFNSETEEYLVTWNDGDISDIDWRGDIYGKIFNPSGGTVVDTFVISSGDFVRTDINTYPMSDFDDPYFVSYDGDSKIWGNIVSDDGEPSSTEIQLSISNDPDMVADWANIDIGDGNVFVVWEDIREEYEPSYYDDFPDAFGNLWEHATQSGSSVSYLVGNEKDQILLAHVTSIKIVKPSSDYWDIFTAICSSSGLEYSILDGDTGDIIISGIEPGDLPYSLSSVTASSLRLMATFERPTPSNTPEIDYWSVNWIVNNPPNAPNNPDPYDGETGVSVDTDLSWSCSDPDGDSLTYDVYFGTSNPPPKIISGQTETTYDPGILSYGTTYHWKIVAFDNHGASTEGPIWSFTTWVNNPPNAPNDPDPYDGETGVDINADLFWNCSDPDGDPLTYDVYWGTSNPPPLKSTGQEDTTYDPGTMDFGETYYWKIEAFDNHGGSTESPVWSFTTGANDPPYEPSNPSPEDGATNVDVNADISWTGGDPNGDIVYYDVYFDIVNPPEDKVSDDQTGTTFEPGTMFFEMTYYWQIVAKDEPGAITEGPIWSFTTGSNDPPYVPSNPSPPDGATDVDIDADISWTGGDPNPGDTVTYDIYLDIKTPPDIFIRDHPDTTYNLQGMSYNTRYYWQIVAKDNNGEETEGPIWYFITRSDINRPPGLPGIDGPTLVPVNVETDFEFWASDPDGDNVYIKVSWGDGEGTGWQGPYSSGEKITLSHAWIKPLMPYVIKAKAKDVNDEEGPEASFPIFITMSKSVQINRVVLYNHIKTIREHCPLLFLFIQKMSTHPILTRLLFNQWN